MIKSKTVVIRLKGVPGTDQVEGEMFETVREHETEAFFQYDRSLKEGFFSLATREERVAFYRGIKKVDIKQNHSKDLADLNNLLTMKAKQRASAENKQQASAADIVGKSKAKYKKWSKENIEYMIGMLRGSYYLGDIELNSSIFEIISDKVGFNKQKVLLKYTTLIARNKKSLKRAGYSEFTFNKIAPIISEYTPKSNELLTNDINALIKHEKDISKQKIGFRDMSNRYVKIAGNKKLLYYPTLIAHFKYYKVAVESSPEGFTELLSEKVGKTKGTIAQLISKYRLHMDEFLRRAKLTKEEFAAIKAEELEGLKGYSRTKIRATKAANTWGSSEIQLLLEIVGGHRKVGGMNMAEVFEKVACILPHSPMSCQKKYYRSIDKGSTYDDFILKFINHNLDLITLEEYYETLDSKKEGIIVEKRAEKTNYTLEKQQAVHKEDIEEKTSTIVEKEVIDIEVEIPIMTQACLLLIGKMSAEDKLQLVDLIKW